MWRERVPVTEAVAKTKRRAKAEPIPKTKRAPIVRTQRAGTSTYVQGLPCPSGRVNLATLSDVVRVKLNLVLGSSALRRLPVSRQIVRRTLLLDVDEVLACLRAEIARAPVIANGIKRTDPDAPAWPPARPIRRPPAARGSG
jgi:hypothetical protein